MSKSVFYVSSYLLVLRFVFCSSALDLEQLDLDEVVARAAGDLEDDDLEGDMEGDMEEEGGERGGRKDENENKGGGKNNSSSIVQALASGVEVAPSRDGKVRHHLFYEPRGVG